MNKGNLYIGILLMGLLIILSSCGKNNVPIETPQPTIEQNPGESFLGILKEKDENNQLISFFNIRTSQDISLTYTGATRVRNKSDQETSISNVKLGEIMEVVYQIHNNMAVDLQISEQAWEYKKVRKLETYKAEKRIRLGERNYRYTDNIVIASEDQLVEMMDLNPVDELTIRGIEENIYSITVDLGHGYIRPSNYESFVGGMISVGNAIIKPISEDMMIVAREGNYNVTMKNGQLAGTKNVVVVRNAETPLDMIEYRPEPEHIGQVEFSISPEGADLYINGTLTDYSDAVSLNYGEHEVRVTLTGYEDYTGVLDVQTANPTITIDLADQIAEVTDETQNETEAAPSSTNSDFNQTDDLKVPSDAVLDKNHTIKVSGPEGVSVYLNGVYKGISPCSFTKQIGTQTITLSRDGYITKSYTVEIIDDDENIAWSFPAMQESS